MRQWIKILYDLNMLLTACLFRMSTTKPQWFPNMVSFFLSIKLTVGFPGGPSGKEPICQCRRYRDAGLIPGWGRSPGGGHGNPLQYSCQENPLDRGTWQATSIGRKSQTQLGACTHLKLTELILVCREIPLTVGTPVITEMSPLSSKK